MMEGMVWAGLLLVLVPLAIGIGVAVVLLRRRKDAAEAGDPTVDARRR